MIRPPLLPLLSLGLTGCGGCTGSSPIVDDSGTLDTGTPFVPPVAPDDLDHWLVGNPDDVRVSPSGPRLLLGGGGADVSSAMAQWLEAAGGGDVVVLRASGQDGYNDYIYTELGGVDSVETLRIDDYGLAADPYVAYRVETAEAVFIAGGDQWLYLDEWAYSGLQTALQTAWDRGAAVGGTSAGAMVLAQRVFSAQEGTVYSDEALRDPYNPYLTFAEDFLAVSPLAGVVLDTHFRERDRMGRLMAFGARAVADGLGDAWMGIGIDEGTAVVQVDNQGAALAQFEVVGSGGVSLIDAQGSAMLCAPGQPLEVDGWGHRRLVDGEVFTLPGGGAEGSLSLISAGGGATDPRDPY